MIEPVWRRLIAPINQGVFFSLPLTDWLSSNIDNALRYSNENFAWNSLFGIVCWLAWKQRNDFVFNDVQEAWDIAVTSITWARHAAGPSREWRRRTTAPMPQTVCWCAPPLNWVKLNTDGAWDPTTGIGKAGGVQAELWAILDGLSTTWNLNFRHLVLECDNARIVKDFQRCQSSRDSTQLVDRVRELLNRTWTVIIQYVPREANFMADNIAKLADPNRRGVSFLDHCPVFLQALLDADRNGEARLRLPQHRLTSCFRSLPRV
ncbi:hypothetical protein K2173_002952 [Erythroxylum novogranatense]|uniref:RNase H type-1 domain-containing protein n=1 Tax=Erythroxylum novogranatense TaxID=1862640 RepID=A0AAV8TR57_9ROSI|nr:hypothetical protein K2173_002952 [Erythroxylum novogranatense]